MNLMSDNVDDLLIYNLSIEVDICRAVDGKQGLSDGSYSEFFSSKYAEDIRDSPKTQPDVSFAPCVQNVTENPHVLCDEMVGKEDDMDHTPEILSGGLNQAVPSDRVQENLNEDIDCIPLGYKVDAQQQRGMRRRCLVFEAAGVSKKNTAGVTTNKHAMHYWFFFFNWAENRK